LRVTASGSLDVPNVVVESTFARLTNEVRLAIVSNGGFPDAAGSLRGSFIQMDLGHCVKAGII
jgi:hypothetical protein